MNLALKEGDLYKGFTVKKGKVSSYYREDIKKYHKLTRRDTYGTLEERTAIGKSMKENGQWEPIAIWPKRGTENMMDGRNRLSGAHLFSIEEIFYIELPSNSTIEDLAKYIEVSRERVNSSITQQAIKAFRQTKAYLGKGVKAKTQKDAAADVGVSIKLVEQAAAIHKLNQKILDRLFKGEKVKIKYEETDVLSNILKFIKNEDAKTKGENVTPEPGSQEAAIEHKKAQEKVDAIKTILSIGDSNTIDSLTYEKMIEQGLLNGIDKDGDKEKIADLSKRLAYMKSVVNVMSQDFNYTQKLSNGMKSIGAIPDFSPASAEEIAAYHKQNPLKHPEDEVKPHTLESIDHEDVKLSKDKIQEDQS